MSLKVFVLIVLVLLPFGDALSRDDFPPHFLFGASASAYQVEGAAKEDGRKPSIWDTFAHAGNANRYTGNADIACDQYHKYKEDVQLMAKMGLDAYRFSISWSRLIPDGKGSINPKGLQYYNKLINELISQGIQAHVTLVHWDLPQALEDEYEGWMSRRIVKDFIAYADVCFREFGDRVKYWTTVNEGNVFAIGGYDAGFVPPQRCSPFSTQSLIYNCSGGNSSTEPYLDRQHGFIGFNLLTYGFFPLTNTSEDISAAKRAQDFYLGWFLNPFTFGEYPDIMKKNVGSRLPLFSKSESNLVKDSIDFLGINYYVSFYVKDNPGSLQIKDRDYMVDMGVELQPVFENGTTTDQFPIVPWTLHGLLDSLRNTYGNMPIYIHENGQQTHWNSSLEDWSRVKCLHDYIGSIPNILRNGVNVRGYFVWSFLDVFELLAGYESSFGLHYIDLNDPTLRRQPKLSAVWYSNFLNGRIMDPMITMEVQKKNPSVVLSTFVSNNPILQKVQLKANNSC
ncbi:hypothetical protein TanjilG_12236 [Lupinus angustifolius]|uniref:Beta-glucosidase n=1 Tax=Lupinus angustifolius TaxID=3871 RepID=A0A1J7GK14_LUPAN|nr:hypothetical protein TanjilG_12236 [Lupinus angustifolius]